MFTGIIEELGVVKGILSRGNTKYLTIEVKSILDGVKIGDSVAVNGACLSVVEIKNNKISFDVVKETSDNTNISRLRIEEKVNLERALKVGDRLSGHFVTGHIDCLGIIQKKVRIGDAQNLVVRFPIELSKFIVSKGSISLDGVSLTIQELKRDTFSIALIPHTLKTTNLALKNVGDKLNLELDLLGKYILKG